MTAARYRAKRFQAANPDAKANGQVLMPYIGVLQGTTLEHLLEDYNVADIDPEQFYPQQTVCDLQSKMLEEAGRFGGQLTNVGIRSIESIGFPEEVTTIGAAMQMLHTIYQAIHQNIPAEEGWEYKEISDLEHHIHFNSPYESFAAYGYIYAIAKRFMPEGMQHSVYMDEDEITTYRVRFEPRKSR